VRRRLSGPAPGRVIHHRPFLDRLPNLRLDVAAPPPVITGLAFRSPKRLDVRVR
jgi:hypothetical protein